MAQDKELSIFILLPMNDHFLIYERNLLNRITTKKLKMSLMLFLQQGEGQCQILCGQYTLVCCSLLHF